MEAIYPVSSGHLALLSSLQEEIFSRVSRGCPNVSTSGGDRRLRIHAHLCLTHSHNPSFLVMAGLHLCEACRTPRELRNHLEALGSLLTS